MGTGHHFYPLQGPNREPGPRGSMWEGIVEPGVGGMAVSQAGRAETVFWKGMEALEKELSFLLSGSMSQKHPALSPGPICCCQGWLLPVHSPPAIKPWGRSAATSAVPEAASSHPSSWLVSRDDVCCDSASACVRWRPTANLHPHWDKTHWVTYPSAGSTGQKGQH